MIDFIIQENGKFSNRCLEMRITSFLKLCHWLNKIPYGYNSNTDSFSLFTDYCGTCMSKHGVAASVAKENKIPVYKYLGFYRLDSSIVSYIDKVLIKYNLNFIPQLHCVLGYENVFFDLTEGNCRGKMRDVGQMDLYFKIEPDISDEFKQRLYFISLGYYSQLDNLISKLSPQKYFDIIYEVDDLHKNHCSIGKG